MGMEFRPYYLAREWIKMGHNVDIIAADFSHLRIKNPSVNKDFAVEVIDGINYYWVKTSKYDGNGAKRALTMAQFVSKLWLNAKRIASTLSPDVIITSSTYPSDTYAGQRIKHFSKQGTVLIHEVHDMWPITPMEMAGMSKWHPFIMLMQHGEDSFCKNSDYVVSLLPCAKEYFISHGMDTYKFHSVSNGIVLEEWQSSVEIPNSLQKTIDEMRENYKFILCFFGSHTQSYALTHIIDAVKLLSRNDVGLLFVGGGFYKKELIKYADGIPNVKFHDSIPKVCIPQLVEAVDGLYVGALRNKMFRFGICMNKLFDSMMSGKPILYAVDAPNNYIQEFNCGITVEAEDVEALRNGLEKLVNMSDEQRELLGKNGKNAVLENFTYQKLAKKFAELFTK